MILDECLELGSAKTKNEFLQTPKSEPHWITCSEQIAKYQTTSKI